MPRGGPREGGGRPALPAEDKRIPKQYKLHPATLEGIQILRGRWGEKSDAKVIERAIREALG